jgi:hypothetical protein
MKRCLPRAGGSQAARHNQTETLPRGFRRNEACRAVLARFYLHRKEGIRLIRDEEGIMLAISIKPTLSQFAAPGKPSASGPVWI